VRRAGTASVLIGIVLSVAAVWTRAPVGSFRLVPEVVVGFQAIALGAVAIVLARPVSERGYGRATAPVFTAAMVLATVATLIVAIDDLRLVAVDPHGPARLFVSLGVFVTEFTVFAGFAWGLLTRLGTVAARVFPKWASRT
jgi:hypothetical protein